MAQENSAKTSTLDRATKGLIFFLVFSLPLFFGLGKVNIPDFNKQVILVFTCFLALTLWFTSKIIKGSFKFRFSILTFLVFAFLISVLISTAFSRWRWGSFWGWPQDSEFCFLTLFCFAILYFLLLNIFEKAEDVFSLQFPLLISGFFVALFGILQLWGRFLLPWDFTKTSSFNTIGTANSWAIFLGALLPPILALIFTTEGSKRIIGAILGISVFVALIVCNYWVAWVEVLISMSVLLTFGLWKLREISPKLLILPMILFSIALVLGVSKISTPLSLPAPLEVSPSLKATFDVSKEMLKVSLKDSIFGWGPGTFKYGWSKFKNPVLNQTVFWNLRFSKGGSAILEMLGSVGILGTISYILIIALACYFGIKELLILQKKKKSFEWILFLGIFCSFVGLSITKFLYPSNVSLGFLWWLFLGSLGAMSAKKEKVFKLNVNPGVSFFLSFLTILILIGSVLIFYSEGTRYLAEAKYNLASKVVGDFEKIERSVLEAVKLNPHQELFWQGLSQIYLTKFKEEISRTDISDKEKTQRAGTFINRAILASEEAIKLNPENVTNWQMRGAVYKETLDGSEKVLELATKSYERALELEPTNPFILVELSRVYLIQANLAPSPTERQLSLEKARDYIREAINLKPDYALAFYQMALIQEAQGKRKEAISTLEQLKQLSPYIAGYNPMEDVGLAFQLGILYYRDEQYDRAQTEFERAITLSPNYSNARYFLGLIYDKKGEKEKAIEQFVEIEKFNPENAEIKKILKNLREGKPALEVPTSEALPLEEKPEER